MPIVLYQSNSLFVWCGVLCLLFSKIVITEFHFEGGGAASTAHLAIRP